MKVVFSAGARDDITAIVKFIARDKLSASRNWAKTVRGSVAKLADFPRMGRIVPEFEDEAIREIIKGEYRIVYKIDEPKRTIVIVAIHHSKRQLPGAM